MTEKSLEERTTILFPRPVEVEELRRMFDAVGEAVPCEFEYTTEWAERRGGRDQESKELLPPEAL